jgi:hypothetical protein
MAKAQTKREFEPHYKVPVAAEATGMSEKWIRREIGAGNISVLRFGRSVRIGASELARLIEEASCKAGRTRVGQ